MMSVATRSGMLESGLGLSLGCDVFLHKSLQYLMGTIDGITINLCLIFPFIAPSNSPHWNPCAAFPDSRCNEAVESGCSAAAWSHPSTRSLFI